MKSLPRDLFPDEPKMAHPVSMGCQFRLQPKKDVQILLYLPSNTLCVQTCKLIIDFSHKLKLQQ